MTSAVPLEVRTEQIAPPGTLPEVLARTAPADQFAWIRDGEGFVAWGRAAAVTTCGPGRFSHALGWWHAIRDQAAITDPVRQPGTGLLALGSFTYSAASQADSALIVPEVIIGHRGGQWWRTRISPACDGRRARPGAPARAPEPPAPPGDITLRPGALPPRRWGAAVAEAVRRIGSGGLEKVVLARDEYIRTGHPVDVRWLIGRLTADYPRTWVFSVDRLIGATPEMLLRLERGLVTSRVLAGTIRRTGQDRADLALAAGLARSSKDLEEHAYAVRSVTGALAPYCTSMNVPESPFVLHLPNVMHLATDVAGRLAGQAGSLELAAALHPSAAVCGTPRQAADALITELEAMDRDRYAGPVGWIDAAGDGEWAIALRCGRIAASDPRLMRIFAGCGIVAGSQPPEEIAESEAKLMPMRAAFGLTGTPDAAR